MHIRRFLGKIASILAIGALSASAYAVADEYLSQGPVGGWGQGEHMWGNGPGSCTPPGCCPDSCNQAPVCGVAYNPPGYFNCSNCNTGCDSFLDSLRFRADFLWWRACEENLALGREELFSSFPDGGEYDRVRIKHPDFKYDPGFRIGFASICPCDCYDVAVNWTHFHTKATVHGESEFADAGIRPGGPREGRRNPSQSDLVFFNDWQLIEDAFPDFAKGKWTLDLDLLDLEFGRKYYVSNCFILRPYLGLRGARIDQTFRVLSEANRFDPYDDASAFFTSQAKARNNFLGVGPRVGVDLEVRLPCCLTLFGQAAGSLVFGRFDRHTHEEFQDFSSESSGFVYDEFPSHVDFSIHATKERCSRAMTDLSIGLKWDHCCNWCNRNHPVTIAFAWEHHAFYDFQGFLNARRSESHVAGDLTTQGLTVRAEVGF